MASTLKIEIETETEQEAHSLLEHVTKEIIEGGQYYNADVELNCRPDEDKWLTIDEGPLQGRYYWRENRL